MELTPELLLEAKFGPSRRGYDMTEVDEFLEEVAELVHVMLDRLSAEFDRAEANADKVAALEARIAELEAGGAAVAPAAESSGPAAEAAAPEVSVDEPMRILVLAERTAEAAVAEAKAEAERIRSEAISSSETMTAEARHLVDNARTTAELEARKAGESARRAVLDELAALRADRDQLTEDTRTLKRWLDDQRGRMRTTARDLQRLVDDPGALRELALPELLRDGTEDPSDAIEVSGPDQPVADDPAAGQDVAVEAPDDDAVSAAETDDESAPAPLGRTFSFDEDDGEPTQAVPAIEAPTVFDVEAEESIADLRDGSSIEDSESTRF